ncbi:MAG: Abortive infection protein [Spirochaeta sp.]|nr:Abortive infection protein [Spirochaeta sp.]
MKIDKKALHFALLFFPIGLLCAWYLAYTNSTVAANLGVEVSLPLLLLATFIQVALVYTLLLAYLGHQLARKVGLLRPFSFEKTLGGKAVLLALLSALVMLSDYFVFAPHIPQVQASYSPASFSLVTLLFSMLYGGVLEEIMLRLFFLSLLVFILDLLFGRTRQGLEIPKAYYHVANLIAAILFALGHLPATHAAFGALSGMLVLRSLVLNGVLGYLFGWVYLKMGIQYAMITHALTHLFFQGILFIFVF